MQKLFRYFVVLVIALFLLSFSVVQCQSTSSSQSVDRPKKSLRSIDYINMCMFRKTRLCDYLREMNNARTDDAREDRDVWKRGMSRFYSNW